MLELPTIRFNNVRDWVKDFGFDLLDNRDGKYNPEGRTSSRKYYIVSGCPNVSVLIACGSLTDAVNVVRLGQAFYYRTLKCDIPGVPQEEGEPRYIRYQAAGESHYSYLEVPYSIDVATEQSPPFHYRNDALIAYMIQKLGVDPVDIYYNHSILRMSLDAVTCKGMLTYRTKFITRIDWSDFVPPAIN